MERLNLPSVGGFILAVIILSSLFVGTHYAQVDREIITLCQDSSEPETIRHRNDGFTKRAVIISHLRYYQRKFIRARINLRHSHVTDESPAEYARQVKELAIALSYWEYQYIQLKQQIEQDNRNLIHRA